MSTRRNYILGQYETKTLQPVGQFDGSVSYLQFDGVLSYAFSDTGFVLYTDSSGTSAVPGTSYNFVTIDATLTAEESKVGGTNDTIYTQIQITDASYQGVELWATFRNFGSYTDNEALQDLLPDTDWLDYFNYTTIPTSVRFGGGRYVNYVASNSGNIPPLNPDKWLPVKPRYELIQQSADALPQGGGLIAAHDRADSDYQQNILVDSVAIDGTTYNLYMVHLDGTQLTGNATLEAIFDPGGSDEYHRIDYYAPDVLGTRTLIDMGERVLAGQSSGGENDLMGAVLADRFQGHFHGVYNNSSQSAGGGLGFFRMFANTGSNNTGPITDVARDPITDSTNGPPRTGLTTRPKELTTGCPYIIVMVAA
jgi:hypothetical protein